MGEFIRRYGVDTPESRREGERLCTEFGVDILTVPVREVVEYADRVEFKVLAQRWTTRTHTPRYWTDDNLPTTVSEWRPYTDEFKNLVYAPDIVKFK